MSLTIGSPGSSTIVDIGSFTAANAASLADSAAPYIDALADLTSVNFSTIGDLPYLGYSFVDFTTELAALQGDAPADVTSNTAAIEADIDAIEAEVQPTAPDYDSPTPAFPSLTAERPVIALPTLPGTDVGDAPSDAPAIDDLALPDAPLVTLPTVPTFEELHVPEPPSFSMPSFSDEAPVNNLVAPTQEFSFVDAVYTSDLRDPLIAKLLYDLENGGYGIDANDELALWGRARDRAEALGRQAVEAAMRRSAQFGMPMPAGALLASLEQARAEVLKQLSEANRDIALKRADLYVENRRFTIEQVQALEKVSIDLFNAIQERALNAAKANVELGVAVFEATVRNFATQLDAYKTGAQVFETRIRAELTKAEVYKAQIDAERLRGEFNKVKADLYQAQLNGIQTTVNLYKTRLEGVNTLAQIQAQRIEIFKSRVQAYATRVQAKAAEYDMYRAAVAGEVAKLEIYKTDVAAYETLVQAESARVSSLLKVNEGLVEKYKAQVEQFRVAIEAVVKRAGLQVEADRNAIAAQSANVSVYRALMDAAVATANARVEGQRTNNAWNIAALNSRVEVVKFRLEELKATYGFREKIDEFGAKFYGDPLTASLAALNGLSVKSE